MLISRAPVRVSFGGGGTDMAAYYERFGGLVISATISKHFYALCNPRDDERVQIISSDLQLTQTVDDFYGLRFGQGLDIPDAVIKHFRVRHGFDLFMASEVPPGSGLGGSGAVTVALVNLFAHVKGEAMDRRAIAESAYFVEHDILNLPVGKQDQYAASFGGLNLIRFSADGVDVTPLVLSDSVLEQLSRRLLLFFTGRTRLSSEILTQQDAAVKRKEDQVVEAMHQLKQLALQMKEALECGDLDAFGRLLDASWQHKKQMSAGITNQLIDQVYASAVANGAIGGKLTGAGGGGYFVFFCEEGAQKRLTDTMADRGLSRLGFELDWKGCSLLDAAGGWI